VKYEYAELLQAAREFKAAQDALDAYTRETRHSGKGGWTDRRLAYTAAYNLAAAHGNDALLAWYRVVDLPQSEP
jgi:hypothetical protein